MTFLLNVFIIFIVAIDPVFIICTILTLKHEC